MGPNWDAACSSAAVNESRFPTSAGNPAAVMPVSASCATSAKPAALLVQHGAPVNGVNWVAYSVSEAGSAAGRHSAIWGMLGSMAFRTRSAMQPTLLLLCLGQRVEDEAAHLANVSGSALGHLLPSFSVRVARVNRPSVGSGVRHTQPRFSSRLTTLDRRDNVLAVLWARSLIRRVRSGTKVSPDRTRYSK